MSVPLHLHGLWIGLLLVYLLLVSLVVTFTLASWWIRWEIDAVDRWPRHKLVVTAVFGIVLTIVYLTWVLIGGIDVIPRDMVQLGLHVVGSGAGIAGGYVLWQLQST